MMNLLDCPACDGSVLGHPSSPEATSLPLRHGGGPSNSEGIQCPGTESNRRHGDFQSNFLAFSGTVPLWEMVLYGPESGEQWGTGGGWNRTPPLQVEEGPHSAQPTGSATAWRSPRTPPRRLRGGAALHVELHA